MLKKPPADETATELEERIVNAGESFKAYS